MSQDSYLIWIDLEMTGLVPESDVIIEIATLITDAQLELVAEGPVIAIHHPESVLEAMDDWCKTTHGQSGLIDRIRQSRRTTADAEQQTLDFVRRYVPKGVSPICGNSICQDRRFLARYMPELEDYFHYRNLDVSTVKELARRWRPDVLASVKKAGKHQALDDIYDSIAELRHYREHFFRLQ